jgi:hypothetical protein
VATNWSGHLVTLTPPKYASSALNAYVSYAQTVIQGSVNQLGSGDPQNAPDVSALLHSHDKELTDASNTGKMAAAYNTDQAWINQQTQTLLNQDGYVKGLVGQAATVAEDAWLNISKNIVSPLQDTLNAAPVLTRTEKSNGKTVTVKYLDEGPLFAAIRSALGQVHTQMTNANSLMQAVKNNADTVQPSVVNADLGGNSSSSAVPSAVVSQALSSGQQTTASDIYNYLTGHYHLTAAEADAMIGNWQVESSLNTGAYNSAEGALGLGQWEGTRLTKLENYVAQQKAAGNTSASTTSWQTQVDFAMAEMKGQIPQDDQRAALSGMEQKAQQDKGKPVSQIAFDEAGVFDTSFEGSSGSTHTQREVDARNLAQTTL